LQSHETPLRRVHMEPENSNLNPQNRAAPQGTGLAPNIAGALAYVLGPVTGIVLLLLERDRFVRFHAFQSLLFSAAWVVFWVGFSIIQAILHFTPALALLVGLLGLLLSLVLGLGAFILWIVLIIRAYQGSKWKLPVIGDMAERYAEANSIQTP
jgi:uncharacterized membrane protein